MPWQGDSPLGPPPMQKINISYFTQLGAALSAFQAMWSEEDSEVFRDRIRKLLQYLNNLIGEDAVPFAMPASRHRIEKFCQLLEEALVFSDVDLEDRRIPLVFTLNNIMPVFEGELSVQATYQVWPKRAFNTQLLSESAELIFSQEIRQWFSQAEVLDARQAGKCLAFETPTAAAFHLFRLTESAIRRYYSVVVGRVPKTKMRSWGAYIDVLEKNNAEPRVIYAIKQMKDLYRNPVMHPEQAYSLDDALSLLGLVDSVINTIFADIRTRSQSNESLLTGLLNLSLAKEVAEQTIGSGGA